MAYADQQFSNNKIIAIVIVVLAHVLLIWGLVAGLDIQSAIEKAQKITTVDIDEEVPEPDEPEKPPEEVPDTTVPPPVAPPPPLNVSVRPPDVRTSTVIPPPSPPATVIPPPAPPGPSRPPPTPPTPPPPPTPTPPPPPSQASAAKPRGSPGSWVTNNDYPSSALRRDEEGTTGFRLTIDGNGRVSDCTVTRSSGSSALDSETCKQLRRRAKFTPAKDSAGNPISGSYSSAVRWQIPK